MPPVFYHEKPLRFECTGCGACCVGRPDDYVALRPGEAEQIAAFLGVDLDQLKQRHLVKLNERVLGVRLRDDGPCVFLDENRRCRIYPARPLQCRTYPYWRELLQSEEAWLDEQRRCEGIARGPAVACEDVDATLALDLDAPLI